MKEEEKKEEEKSHDKSQSQLLLNQLNNTSNSQGLPNTFKRMRTVRDGRHERQGFTEDCFNFIQQSQELRDIVDTANSQMYNLRQNCAVYNIDPERIVAIVDTNSVRSSSEKPYIPVRQLDVLG